MAALAGRLEVVKDLVRRGAELKHKNKARALCERSKNAARGAHVQSRALGSEKPAFALQAGQSVAFFVASKTPVGSWRRWSNNPTDNFETLRWLVEKDPKHFTAKHTARVALCSVFSSAGRCAAHV